MSDGVRPSRLRHPRLPAVLRALVRRDCLAGFMFIAIAAAGLWLSRNYPVGTLRRMGSGFMPQALCWLLMGLGGIVLLQGLLARETAAEAGVSAGEEATPQNFWSIALVAASLVAFALTIEPFGLVVAILALVVIASFAYRGLKWWETLLTAGVMTVLCWAVFVMGLGMSVKVLPEF